MDGISCWKQRWKLLCPSASLILVVGSSYWDHSFSLPSTKLDFQFIIGFGPLVRNNRSNVNVLSSRRRYRPLAEVLTRYIISWERSYCPGLLVSRERGRWRANDVLSRVRGASSNILSRRKELDREPEAPRVDLMDSSRTILNRLLRKRSDPHLSSKGGHLSTGWERNSDLSASVSTGQHRRISYVRSFSHRRRIIRGD